MIDEKVLGTPRKHNDGVCSKCGNAIPDDAVPLMLWADGGNLMWLYCEDCEQAMFTQLEVIAPGRKQHQSGS